MKLIGFYTYLMSSNVWIRESTATDILFYKDKFKNAAPCNSTYKQVRTCLSFAVLCTWERSTKQFFEIWKNADELFEELAE